MLVSEEAKKNKLGRHGTFQFKLTAELKHSGTERNPRDKKAAARTPAGTTFRERTASFGFGTQPQA